MRGFKYSLLLIFLLAMPLVLAQEVKIDGFINDYADIITPDQKPKIESVLNALYNDKIAEFSVVTINSLEGQDIDSYALNLAQGKLGDKEKNNGLLLVVSVQDQKYKFEVGRGIEPILNDAKIGRVGRNYIVENFRNEEYGKGIYESVIAVDGILRGQAEPEIIAQEPSKSEIITFLIFISAIFFFSFVLPIILVAKAYRNRKDKNKFFDAALIAALLFSNRGRGRGGFGGGGFGGGGFGGFGGGGFGGGGAGGGW
ncbi:MAG: TPM domain-containing protein [Nanoarchaeota archaeon]|nr:TPM domain-containing protein [Nanoarchaeota archaeon]MBU1004832.1 TPM domain-containing protein [Nanoarchaeota archaeon]MBU1946770.1 TPM domain-containing protein [Nanoarchaeota archaeon]